MMMVGRCRVVRMMVVVVRVVRVVRVVVAAKATGYAQAGRGATTWSGRRMGGVGTVVPTGGGSRRHTNPTVQRHAELDLRLDGIVVIQPGVGQHYRGLAITRSGR